MWRLISGGHTTNLAHGAPNGFYVFVKSQVVFGSGSMQMFLGRALQGVCNGLYFLVVLGSYLWMRRPPTVVDFKGFGYWETVVLTYTPLDLLKPIGIQLNQ